MVGTPAAAKRRQYESYAAGSTRNPGESTATTGKALAALPGKRPGGAAGVEGVEDGAGPTMAEVAIAAAVGMYTKNGTSAVRLAGLGSAGKLPVEAAVSSGALCCCVPLAPGCNVSARHGKLVSVCWVIV